MTKKDFENCKKELGGGYHQLIIRIPNMGKNWTRGRPANKTILSSHGGEFFLTDYGFRKLDFNLIAGWSYKKVVQIEYKGKIIYEK